MAIPRGGYLEGTETGLLNSGTNSMFIFNADKKNFKQKKRLMMQQSEVKKMKQDP